MRRQKTSYVLVFVFVIGAAIAFAQDQGREFHWKGKLAADKLVAIKNINGDIDVQATDVTEVEVTAEKSGPRADEVRIQVVPSEDGVTICSIYPGSSGECGRDKHYGSNGGYGEKAKVHYTVRMPRNLRLYAGNVNGNIRAENMGRLVTANSVNGNINVSTASWAEAETVNGKIKASMGDAGWNGTLKIESVNGSIELDLPSDLNTDVKFSSMNGQINSDFPLTINNSWPVGHSASGVIGKGGRELAIKTVNGSVALRKGSAGI